MAVTAPEPAPSSSKRVPGKGLKAIRAALSPEERGDFDRGYREVMATANEDLGLDSVLEFIERWWRVAVLSMDAQRHHAVLDGVACLNCGESVAAASAVDMIKARSAAGR